MHRFRRSPYVAILAALVFSACAAPAVSQHLQLTPIGFRTDEVNQFAAIQKGTQWCWAACIQMALGSQGISVSQEDIVRRTYGCDPFGRLPDWSASDQAITANLNGWAHRVDGKRVTVRAQQFLGAPPPNVIVNELTNRRPIILAYKTSPFMGHVVLCTAATVVQGPQGASLNSVIIRDPMSGRQEVQPFALNAVVGYWIIVVR
ncbi:MAG: C39 family peptidase [Phycisphaerales bacterium]|nr:C39 family peptidase [Phycisphaerales bacterium]